MNCIWVTPAMLYLIKRSDLCVSLVLMGQTFHKSLLEIKNTCHIFMGRDVIVCAEVKENHGNEFYSTEAPINEALQNILNGYLKDIKFYYCLTCQILRAYYKSVPENEECCGPMKLLDTNIGLKFFELTSIIRNQRNLDILEVPRVELLEHLI